MVFGKIRFREVFDISTLPTVLTADPRRVGRVLCRWANELDKLIPFRMIYNSAMIILALSVILCGRWGQKKVADIYATTPSPVNDDMADGRVLDDDRGQWPRPRSEQYGAISVLELATSAVGSM